MVVVAGPPGSGKSTSFPLAAFGVDAFNIDDRCAQLVGSYRAIPPAVRAAVARECERFIVERIAGRTSFAVETTLRTTAAVEQARTARREGFLTELRFVSTSSADVNVARIRQRAESGGHAASESQIRDIYEASLRNLAQAVGVFERCMVYDSTEEWVPPQLVATITAGEVILHGDRPRWLSKSLQSGTAH